MLQPFRDQPTFAQLRSLYIYETGDLAEWAMQVEFPVLHRLFLADSKLLSIETFCRSQTLKVLSIVACTKLQSVEGIGAADQLERLELVYCPTIWDAREIAKLDHLRALTIDGCPRIPGFEFLKELRQLKGLHVSGSAGSFDVGIITQMQSLESLFLAETEMTNLELVGGLQRLKRLTIWGKSGLEELSPFAELRLLEELDLTGCRNVKDVGALSNLPGLKRVLLNETVKAVGVPDELRPIVSWVESRRLHAHHYRYRFGAPQRYLVHGRRGPAYYLVPRWVSDDWDSWQG